METESRDTDVSDLELSELFHGYTLDHDTAAHYRGRLRRQLLINRCVDCHEWHHAPKPICPSCLSERVSPTPVTGQGTIYMAVFLHQGPQVDGIDYSKGYPVITVELDEQTGLRYSSTVVGSPNEDIQIGRRVRLDWIERGGVPVPVFRLTDTGKSV